MAFFDFLKKKDPLDDLGGLSDDNPFLNGGFGQQNDGLGRQEGGFAQQDSSSQPPLPNFEQRMPDSGFQNSSISYPQGYPQHNSQQNNTLQQEFSGNRNNHEMELILSKLDIIKSVLENLNQRVSLMEQKIDIDNERRKRSW